MAASADATVVCAVLWRAALQVRGTASVQGDRESSGGSILALGHRGYPRHGQTLDRSIS